MQNLKGAMTTHEPPTREIYLPDIQTLDLLAESFKNAHAFIVAAPYATVLLGLHHRVLVGFQTLMSRLSEHEKHDGKERSIIWILDPHDRPFTVQSTETRTKFLNIEEVRARIKYVHRESTNNNDTLWDWMCARGAVVIYDRNKPTGQEGRSMLQPNIVTLTETPPIWNRSVHFRALYGIDLAQVHMANFSIFLHAHPEEPRSSSSIRFSYIGNANMKTTPSGNSEVVSLELPMLENSYAEAYATISSAVAHTLDLKQLSTIISIPGAQAVRELEQAGARILTIPAFLQEY